MHCHLTIRDALLCFNLEPRRAITLPLSNQRCELSEALAEALRQAITASEMSQATLAQETGIDPGVISRFIRGERSLSLETASKIADLLGLELRPKKKDRKR